MSYSRKIRFYHHLDELSRRYPGLPIKVLFCLGGVAKEQIDLCRPEIARVDFDQDLASRTDRDFITSGTSPYNWKICE
jgi:hypothetical protein